MYGFDIDFLKELDLEDMMEDLPKEHYPKADEGKHANKKIEELQAEFDPKKSAVRTLRGRCTDYRDVQ